MTSLDYDIDFKRK